MTPTRDAWNARATVLWGLLAMLGLAVTYACDLGLLIGMALLVAAGALTEPFATWMLGPPPPKDTPP